jgi:hypothetical protein
MSDCVTRGGKGSGLMDDIIWLVGAVVIVMLILGFFGLR